MKRQVKLTAAIWIAIACLLCLLPVVHGQQARVPGRTRRSKDTLPRFRWQNFTTANGLPDNHVFCVLVDGDRVWAGTENGLALYERGQWKVFNTKDGLAHRAVLSLALDKRTGDL